MNESLLLIRGVLTFVKAYCFLPLVIFVCFYGAAYGLSLQRVVWSDIRYPGTNDGWQTGYFQTRYLRRLILSERRANRHLPTIILIYGLPAIVALLILSLIYG